MYDEINYPFLNFDGATVEVEEWISNSTPLLAAWLHILNGIKNDAC